MEVSFNLGDKIPARELLLLLAKIDETGSLNRAVNVAGMSYRYAWGLLNRTEEALGKALVLRQTGGPAGGGTVLSADGRKLLGHLQSLQREVQSQIETLLANSEGLNRQHLMLASTMEPVVTGLLDVLEQAYFLESGVTVRHVAAGSGQAIAMAKAGRVDLVLTHAPVLETTFVAEGWGTQRIPVMSNNFVLVGPPADPACTREAAGVLVALQRIAGATELFISRGDQSGTHLFERELWGKAGIDPRGREWYKGGKNALGSYGVLNTAGELRAYTLVDQASFVTSKLEQSLQILLSRDDLMTNIFSVIPVSRQKAAVNQNEAEVFASWLLTPSAVNIINSFGARQYGEPLFRATVNL